MYFAHHSGMLTSSLAEAGVVPLLVFQWMLEHADEDGVVRDARTRRIAHDLALIDSALFTDDRVTEAIARLQAPDASSKRRDHEGRRIVPHSEIGSAFTIPSFTYYNEEWMAERRRVKAAVRKRRQRQRDQETEASCHADVTVGHADVTVGHAESRPKPQPQSQSESQTEPERRGAAASRRRGRARALGTTIPHDFEPNDDGTLLARHLGLDSSRERAKFLAHYASTGETRADWHSAFLAWLYKALPHRARAQRDPAGELRPRAAGTFWEHWRRARAGRFNAVSSLALAAGNGSSPVGPAKS